MAEEILVKEPLTREMVDAGVELLGRLESAGLKIAAAFWLYTSDVNEWRLTLAIPQANKTGTREIYGVVWDVLHGNHDKLTGLGLHNVTVLRSDDALVEALADANKMFGLSNSRLTRTRLNGIYVEDVYIYFVADWLEASSGTKWISK